MKERIGDALRNAAMRFGAALDLWHKGDLHKDEEPEQPEEITKQHMEGFVADINKCATIEDLLATGDVIGAKPLSELQRAEIAAVYSKRKREIKNLVAA
jgi:hypothetical protein